MKSHLTKRLAKLPPGLTQSQVAAKLGLDHQQARRLILSTGYQWTDGRATGQHARRKLDPAKVDWAMSTPEICRTWKVSRQRVHIVRREWMARNPMKVSALEQEKNKFKETARAENRCTMVRVSLRA